MYILIKYTAVGVSVFTEKSAAKVYGSTLRGGGWGSNFQEKSVRGHSSVT